MARKAGRTKPMSPKAGVTKTRRKNHIWQYIGYTPQRDNDEVDAYLLTYIYDKITQVFYKHKDNKE